jgi:hypothetical protein
MMCKKKISTLGYSLFSLFHAAMLQDTQGDLEASGKICFCSSEMQLTQQAVNSLPSPQRTTTCFWLFFWHRQMRHVPRAKVMTNPKEKKCLPPCPRNSSFISSHQNRPLYFIKTKLTIWCRGLYHVITSLCTSIVNEGSYTQID